MTSLKDKGLVRTLRRRDDGSSLEIRQTLRLFRTASGPVSVNRRRAAETPTGRWNNSQNAVGTFVAAAAVKLEGDLTQACFNKQTNKQGNDMKGLPALCEY